METTNIIELIKSEREKGNNKFVCVVHNGEKFVIRLFVSSDGDICYYAKGSKKYGHLLPINAFQSITPVAVKNKCDLCQSYIKKCIKYLTNSGLWPEIKADLVRLQAKDKAWWDNYLAIERGFDRYKKMCEEFEHLHLDILEQAKYGFKTINFSRYDEKEREDWTNAVKNHTQYHYRWRKGYDNSISVDGNHAWYSEEYKGCGNGHYYLAFDDKHATFREDD